MLQIHNSVNMTQHWHGSHVKNIAVVRKQPLALTNHSYLHFVFTETAMKLLQEKNIEEEPR